MTDVLFLSSGGYGKYDKRRSIENSLGDYLKKEDIAGVSMKFRAKLSSLK
jgi:acid stress-induced BolA-like protein IbaG/YrbA